MAVCAAPACSSRDVTCAAAWSAACCAALSCGPDGAADAVPGTAARPMAAATPTALSRARSRPPTEARSAAAGESLRGPARRALRCLVRIAVAVSGATDEDVEFVVEAERLGADSVWMAETWGYDAFTPLAFLAARTSRIRLATGIAQLGARTPA